MNFLAKIGKFLREVRAELRKVIWPNRQETILYTLVVVIAVVIVAGLFSIIDAVFGELLALIIS